jgi:hypothetical protein
MSKINKEKDEQKTSKKKQEFNFKKKEFFSTIF